jgi:DNA-directed RNA polymerase subunit RPC12/RpoP
MDEQNKSDDISCAQCGSVRVEAVPNWYHYQCAYIGPAYDFPLENGSFYCPKCAGRLETEGADWEVVGRSFRCVDCGREFVDNHQDS